MVLLDATDPVLILMITNEVFVRHISRLNSTRREKSNFLCVKLFR